LNEGELIRRLQVLAGISSEPIFFQQRMLPLVQEIVETITDQMAREKSLTQELVRKEMEIANLKCRIDILGSKQRP